MDTLILDSCRIATTRTTTGTTTRHLIDSGTIILPGGVLVYGRDSATFSDYTYGFSMPNTRKGFLFLCEQDGNDILIDSVGYSINSTPVDSVNSQIGFVSSLRNDKIGEAPLAENWCLTKMENDENYGSATPGEMLSDCL
jgi:hypothetical protein